MQLWEQTSLKSIRETRGLETVAGFLYYSLETEFLSSLGSLTFCSQVAPLLDEVTHIIDSKPLKVTQV